MQASPGVIKMAASQGFETKQGGVAGETSSRPHIEGEK